MGTYEVQLPALWNPLKQKKNPVGTQQLKVHGGSIWRKRQGSSGLRLVQKGEKKKYQSGAHGGNNCIETEHMQDKKEEQTFRKRKKKNSPCTFIHTKYK